MIPKPLKNNPKSLSNQLRKYVADEELRATMLAETHFNLMERRMFTPLQIRKLFNSDWGEAIVNDYMRFILEGTFIERFKKYSDSLLQEDYDRFVTDAPAQEYVPTKRLKIKKKDVLDGLIAIELNHLDELLQVLEDLKLVEPEEGYELSESDAFNWVESHPSREEKKRVLTALGYDVHTL